jgi:hypothetical protein
MINAHVFPTTFKPHMNNTAVGLDSSHHEMSGFEKNQVTFVEKKGEPSIEGINMF